MLALITLLLAVLLEGLMCYILPTGTNTIDKIGNTEKYLGLYNLEIENYQPYTMPYNCINNSAQLNDLLKKFYTSSNRPGIKLDNLSNNSIAEYVLQKRKLDIRNLVGNYYTAMNFSIIDSSSLFTTIYYSTLAYHSSASMINEMSNLLLAFYNSNSLSKTITTYNAPIPGNDSLYTGNDFLKYLSCIDILPLSMLNYINGVILGFFISLFVVHVGRERVNGSKQLQLLSGCHFSTYWISNFIFDFFICFLNVVAIVGVIKLVDNIRNDPLSETYPIASYPTIIHLFLLLLLSSFSWIILAYVWSNFFKNEIIGFVILVVVLGMAAFMDMVWCFFQLFIRLNIENRTLNDVLSNVLEVIRWSFVCIFPNVTIKRGLFDLKIQKNKFCIDALNRILKSKKKF